MLDHARTFARIFTGYSTHLNLNDLFYISTSRQKFVDAGWLSCSMSASHVQFHARGAGGSQSVTIPGAMHSLLLKVKRGAGASLR